MYKFLNIKHDSLDESIDKEELFNTSQYLKSAPHFFIEDSQKIINLLQEKMNADERYYLMHERMLYKGKLIKFIGHVVISDKQSILSYITNSISDNDLRPIRIMPVDTPNWLIQFTEDAVMYVYG